MGEKNDLPQLHIEALRVLARTHQPNRVVLIERNIDSYLKPSLERLRDAINREEAEKRQGEDWSMAKDYVRSRLDWLT
jgi:hypothetical protein